MSIPPTRRCSQFPALGRAAGAGLALSLLSSLVLMPAGCGLPTALTAGPESTYARPFPPDLLQYEQLDVQARRKGHELTITNSTAERFEASTIWVNQRFSHPLQSLDMGQRVTLDLRQFVDEYSEHFRGGGFFATERPADAMLIQIETQRDGQTVLLGLVSVGDTPN